MGRQREDAQRLSFKSHAKRHNAKSFLLALVIILGLCFLIAGVIMMVRSTKCEKHVSVGDGRTLAGRCAWSSEAQRIGLEDFLNKVQNEYYKFMPQYLPWKPGLSSVQMKIVLRERFHPYNPEPNVLKRKSDKAKELLREVSKMEANSELLKTRENRALNQVQHFLESNFGVPFDDSFYAGDWMLGPNIFCWQPICDLSYSLADYADHMKPSNPEDMEAVIKTIMEHKTSLEQYRANVHLGIRVGMVRSVVDCQAGVDALKEKFNKIYVSGSSSGILEESFVQKFLQPSFLEYLSEDDQLLWQADNNQSVQDSVRKALITGLGEPILQLIDYLQNEHLLYCLPTETSGGLSRLPVEYVYYQGVPLHHNRTTRTLPLTGQALDGKATYKQILPYFTTTHITPEDIFSKGKNQLDFFYNQIKDIAKNYTKITDEEKAISKFKERLNSTDQWHNPLPFPTNESDSSAHKRCNTAENAEKFCPVRWKYVQVWANYMRRVMADIIPKLTSAFYFTGNQRTVPSCPIEMLPHYNPSLGTMFFQTSDAVCSGPSYFGLPFFLKRYGPKFQEWSVNAHEARPGHHFQIQGGYEIFADKCGGVTDWLNKNSYYIAFQEGWALYAENPIMSDDTNLYDSDMLQKYGMLKWQVWRAVRLIVDTGLHYRNMSRQEALKVFEDYTWDTTDFAVKEVTRYQSVPGQATAYMLGRLALLNMRRKAEQKLGDSFDLKSYHYQVLSQGSSPLGFLHHHIDRWINCQAGKGKESKMCREILNPAQDASVAKTPWATSKRAHRSYM